MTRLRSSILPLSLLATSLLPLACGGSDSPPAVCGELESYTSTVPNQLSFATDIYPILTNTDATVGCAQAARATAPRAADRCRRHDEAAVRLRHRRRAGDGSRDGEGEVADGVGQRAGHAARASRAASKNSLMSYKISGKDGLTCVSSMCQADASVGISLRAAIRCRRIGVLIGDRPHEDPRLDRVRRLRLDRRGLRSNAQRRASARSSRGSRVPIR